MTGARPTVLVAVGICLAAASLTPASAQEELTVTADAMEVDLTGRVQVQAATSSCSSFPFEEGSPCAEQAPGLDLFMRRVRLAAVVKIDEFLTAKVEPDFGDVDEVVLRDAYGQLTFGDRAKVRVGQFKKPFDGFNLVSSSQLLTIERDLDVPGVPGLAAPSLDEFTTRFRLASYDVGAMFFGETGEGRFAYWAGVFNGEPAEANEDTDGEKQLVGRVAYNTRAGGLPLQLAAAAALTDLPFRGPEDQPGARVSADYYSDFELFAELGGYEPGPHVQAGVVFGDNPTRTPAGGDPLEPPPGGQLPGELATMVSWQAVGAYRLATEDTRWLEAVEPSLRITWAEPNTDLDDDEAWGFTPGVNVYFHGRNKLQVGWDFVAYADDGTESVSSFKSQFQVYF